MALVINCTGDPTEWLTEGSADPRKSLAAGVGVSWAGRHGVTQRGSGRRCVAVTAGWCGRLGPGQEQPGR